MKKNILFICIGLIISQMTYSQSTEIKPGIILPQMTSAQRIALSATNGMLIFDTGTQSYWFRENGSWTELPKSGSSTNFWQQSGLAGNEIKNTNSGGFWSANPIGLTNSSDNTTNPPTTPVSGAGTRLMWIPSRSAFRVGTIHNDFEYGTSNWDANQVGLFSFASGYNTVALGYASIAMGVYNRAYTDFSTAIGRGNTANGIHATALGHLTRATEESATAIGEETTASGRFSTAMGKNSTASGESSTAMGENTTASGWQASTAMGYNSTASGGFSTAVGYYTQAIGESSTAIGNNTIARRNNSTAVGQYNFDNPNAIFMVGNGLSSNGRVNALTIRGDNNYVGIGEDNPIAHLHVGSYGLINSQTQTAFYAGGAMSTYPNWTNHQVGIYANHSIISGNRIGAALYATASDSRTKIILNRSDDVADLELLKKLQITNYRMKDVATWGMQNFKKVIAQEVEMVYPQAVSKQTSIIPDIYKLAQKVVYNESKRELLVEMEKDYKLKVGDMVELIHLQKGQKRCKIVAVSGNSFTVRDWQDSTDKIFVFGREVDDFRVVDYEALSMLGISAIQALAKEIDELKKQNFQLKSDFESRLNTIEILLKNQNFDR